MNEFRRLINRKIIFIFAAFIMLNVAFYVYQQATLVQGRCSGWQIFIRIIRRMKLWKL